MSFETIKGMINNSTWIDPENNNIYRFLSNDKLSINGKDFVQYSLNRNEDQIILKVSTEQKYCIEYVNDFHLRIYNNEKKFRIIPA
jgi:hypothetical protein